MNTSERPAGRDAGRRRLGATSSLVLTAVLLVAACVPAGGSPPPDDDSDDRVAAPPAHFVLSITPVGIGPNPTVTITLPPPTVTRPPLTGTSVPPTATVITQPPRPPLTGTVVPTTIPTDPTIPHPTIWDPPPVDEDPADGDEGDVWDTIPNDSIPRTTIPRDHRITPKRVVLACNPDAGTHPNPKGACTSLRNVNGYFEKLPADPTALCTAEYAPVKVEAIGYWGSRKVSYTETFSNPCVAAVSTDYVFRF